MRRRRHYNPVDGCPNCGSANYYKVKEVPHEWGGGSFYECVDCQSMYNYAQGADIEGVCDFCSSRPVVVMYPCRDFEYEISASFLAGLTERTREGSEGPWGACQPCHEIIEKDTGPTSKARRLLIQRSMREHGISKSPREAFEFITKVYHSQFNGFFRNRVGPFISVVG